MLCAGLNFELEFTGNSACLWCEISSYQWFKTLSSYYQFAGKKLLSCDLNGSAFNAFWLLPREVDVFPRSCYVAYVLKPAKNRNIP